MKWLINKGVTGLNYNDEEAKRHYINWNTRIIMCILKGQALKICSKFHNYYNHDNDNNDDMESANLYCSSDMSAYGMNDVD